jgi:hypothetical protein
MPRPSINDVNRPLAPGPEFDLAKAWADSRYSPAQVYRIWRALYRAYGSARQQFPDVDWISLIVILDVIAMARASRRRVDVSYLAVEMGWPRTTTLRRVQRYAGCGYLTLMREGRHTYIDNTRESRRAALKMIDLVIDNIDEAELPGRTTQHSGLGGLRRTTTANPI